MFRFITLLLLSTTLMAADPVRIVCIGDSITQGRAGRGTTVPFHAGRDVSPTLIRKIARDIKMDPEEFVAGR